MKRLKISLFIVILIIVSLSVGGCSKNSFEKSIDANDLKLEYTVYPNGFISVTITPLTDIENLKVQVMYYQDSNILRQDSEWIEVEFLEKNDGYNLMKDIKETYPFDRVGLYSIQGKKRNNSETLTEKIRHGIIKAPTETLNHDLFTIRVDTSKANNGSHGTAYIKSSIDLYGVSLGLEEFFTNQMPVTYYPNDINFLANQEVGIELKKMQSDTGILSSVKITSKTEIKGRKQPDLEVNG